MHRGKVNPLNLMLHSDTYIAAFQNLGVEEQMSQELFSDLESFTCLMYGYKHKTHSVMSINQCRYKKFMSRFKPKKNKLDTNVSIDIPLLPPSHSSLYLHAKRCNYQSAIWRRATDRNVNISEPTNHGWIITEKGLEIEWIHSDMMPTDLAAILVSNPPTEEDEINELDPPSLSNEDEHFQDED